MFKTNPLIENLNRIYDQGFASEFHEAFFDYSGFSNFGYWDTPDLTPAQAAQKLVLKLLEPIQPLQGQWLDVACGQGGTTACLNTFLPGSQILAINISQQQLNAARQNAPDCSFKQMNATQLDLEDNSLDGILCVEAIFHFETRRAFLKEAYRVLKPGGHLVLSDVFFRIPPPAKIIPRANRVPSLDNYRSSYLEAGLTQPRIEHVLKESWKSCRNNLRRFAAERKKQGESQGFREQALNEMRCRIYDAVIADYILVWSQKPTYPAGF